jgi:hypothetical protein
MCDLVIDPTQLNREYLTESAALNHSAILPPIKYRQMPAAYRIADVIETIVTYYMVFCEDKMCDLVFDSTHINCKFLTESAGLDHSAILPQTYRHMPAPYRIADVIETIATYYMVIFQRQDVRPGI